MKKIYFLLPLLVFTLMFTSCNKDDDPEPTTAKITVTSTVEDFGTIANIAVTLFNSTSDVAISTKNSDSNGKVVFENVSPGTYYVEALYIETSTGDEADADTDDFVIAAGDEKSINLSLIFL